MTVLKVMGDFEYLVNLCFKSILCMSLFFSNSYATWKLLEGGGLLCSFFIAIHKARGLQQLCSFVVSFPSDLASRQL